jgi:hypothetical protein
MKLIFATLLLLNIGFFAWKHWQSESPPVTERTEVSIPDGVNQLMLLSEVDTSELRARAPTAVSLKSETHVATDQENHSDSEIDVQSRVCLSIGPLDSNDDIGRMQKWLEDHGGAIILRVGERRELATYWVYFPPFPNRSAAAEQLRQMKEDGVEDISVIPRGDNANAVSLGVYSRRSSLERRLAQLRDKGYQPSVTPRYRTQKASWLDVEFPRGSAFPQTDFADTFPSSEVTPTSCPS